MKKLYTFSLAVAFLISLNAKATMYYVAVGSNSGGTPANQFTPNVTNALVGDTVTFVLAFGTHNVTSTSVPAGAAAMSSGTLSTMGQQYVYPITQPGTYNYQCTFHSGMTGVINATVTNVAEQSIRFNTSAYPNPFENKLSFSYSGVESVAFYNVVGDLVKKIDFNSAEGKVDVDFEGMPAGMYFYRTFKNDKVVETKKIIKSK